MKRNDKSVGLRVPQEICDILQEEADASNVTLSWVIRKALAEYVKNKSIRIPAIEFTGVGDQIGTFFKTKEGTK